MDPVLRNHILITYMHQFPLHDRFRIQMLWKNSKDQFVLGVQPPKPYFVWSAEQIHEYCQILTCSRKFSVDVRGSSLQVRLIANDFVFEIVLLDQKKNGKGSYWTGPWNKMCNIHHTKTLFLFPFRMVIPRNFRPSTFRSQSGNHECLTHLQTCHPQNSK